MSDRSASENEGIPSGGNSLDDSPTKRDPESPESAYPYDLSEGCPYCGGKDWKRGPSAGGNVNLECSDCGSRWNLMKATGNAHEIQQPSDLIDQ